jgi:hypothetical protein
VACIGPVVDYQKRVREVSLNALRGRTSGLYFADEQTGAVDVNVRLIGLCGVWVVVMGKPA